VAVGVAVDVAEGDAVALAVEVGDAVAVGVGVDVDVAVEVAVAVAVGVGNTFEPSIATEICAGGAMLLASVSTASPKATAEVRFVVGDAVMVITCVWLRLPVKAKFAGRTVMLKPGVKLVPAVDQFVATLRVFRTVRVQEQVGVQFMFRADGTFRVLGSPLVGELGSAARKFAKVSCMTSPARAAFVRSTRPLPTSSAFHGVAPSSLVPPSKLVIIIADFTSGAVQAGFTARTRAAAPVRCGADIEVPLRFWYPAGTTASGAAA
jgi:hypothetical protein